VNQTLAKNEQAFLSVLPCACANLRRASRAVTRMYNHELRETGLEATQYTLLMGLDLTGETTQGELGTLLGLDSTTLTRMLGLLTRHRWILIRPGKDRRERLVRLSVLGKEKLLQSRGHWERAQKQLRKGLGEDAWNQMAGLLSAITRASSRD
jgi:DNA-binding MarR family transcriptional regulator